MLKVRNLLVFIVCPFLLSACSTSGYLKIKPLSDRERASLLMSSPQDVTPFQVAFSTFDSLPADFARLLDYPPLVLFSHNEPSELGRVKKILDEHFRYTSDMRQYQEHRIWRSPLEMQRDGKVFVGDLEDYAILARAMLHKRHIPARIAMLDTLYDGQMVMVTEANGMVIDRLQKEIRPRKYYQFQMLSQISLTEPWRIP